jgi:hypothetical protein
MIDEISTEKKVLLEEISSLGDILHGSWVERYTTCSNKKCRCHKNAKYRHGPRRYLVINENGRQRQKYIATPLVDKTNKDIRQHHRLKEIVDRLTAINLVLMKEDC